MRQGRRYRMTSQRQIILDVLRLLRNHPTADEVYDSVKKRLPRISLGTVYRNLEILSAQGLIQKLDMSGAQRRFDDNPEQHYHIRCLKCGLLRDIFPMAGFSLTEMVKDTGNFKILGANLEILGLCPGCREEGAASPPGDDTNQT